MSGSVSSLDPSIPGRALVAPVNPLAQMGSVQSLLNAQAQNRLVQQETANAALSNQQGQQTLQTGQMNQGIAASDRVAGSIAGLMKLPPGQLTPEVIKNGIDFEVANGVPASIGQTWKAAVDNSGGNDAALRQILMRGLVARMAGPDAYGHIFGTPTSVVQGSDVLHGVVPPADTGSGFVPATSTPLSLTPAELVEPTPLGVNADLSPRMGIRKQFIHDVGAQLPGGPTVPVTPQAGAPPAPGAQPAPGAPPPASPLGTGRFAVPAALRNPNLPSGTAPDAPAPAAAPPPAAPPHGITSGASPAQIAAATEQGGLSARAFSDIADQGASARARGAVIDNLLGDTTQFTTGPLSDRILRLRELGGRFGLPVDEKATTAAESFNKLVAQLNTQQGASTDARLAVTQAGNVHSDLSPQGVDLMLRQLRGNEDYIGARSQLAAAYPNKADRIGFDATVGKQLDPRVFQYARMTAEQKATFYNSIPPANRPAFKTAYGFAETNHLLGGGNAAQ